MKIPVFHDDQHGTAIVAAAALLNALQVVGKQIEDVKLVCSGAGAAAIACLNIVVGLGVRRENVWVTDSKGVVYRGRAESMDPQKAHYAQDTEARTLAEIIAGRRRVLRPVHGGRAQAGDGGADGRAADHPGHGQPRPGDPARAGQGGAAGLHHRHRPLGLPEPGQQRPVLPVHLPRRARRRRHHDQRGDEARLRARDRRARARRRLRRGGRGLWPAGHPVRPGISDPAAVRPAPDHDRGAGRGRGGDGERGRDSAAGRPEAPIAPAWSATSTPPAR